MAKQYTKEEDATLIEFYAEEGAALCAEVLERPVKGIQMRAARLGLTRNNYVKPYTTESYKEKLKLVNSDFELLGGFKGTKTKILHRHIVCGFEWEVVPDSILRGSGCPKCGGVLQKTHTQYIAEVKKDFPEYEVIGTYVNNKTKIIHRHKCGYEWEISPNKLLRDRKCPHCSRRKTTEEYEVDLKAIRPEFTITESYTHSLTEVTHKHLVCGFEFKARPADMLNYKACPNCAYKESNIVYFIYFEDLKLYKVGITNNMKVRMQHFGYKASVLTTKTFEEGLGANHLEKQILEQFKDFKINTRKLTSGNTETLRLSSKEVSSIIEMLK